MKFHIKGLALIWFMSNDWVWLWKFAPTPTSVFNQPALSDSGHSAQHLNTYSLFSRPARTAVYLQCPAVYTADTLEYMECICSGGCKYTLQFHSKLIAVQLQCNCSLHAAHTARTLHIQCICTPVRSGRLVIDIIPLKIRNTRDNKLSL